MKKLLLSLFIPMFIMLFFNNVVFADDTIYTEGALQYTIDENECIKIVNYFGDDKVIEIPRAIGLYEKNGEYLPRYVTSIAATTFKESEITEIKIPDTVTLIEEGTLNDSIKIVYYDSFGNEKSKDDKHDQNESSEPVEEKQEQNNVIDKDDLYTEINDDELDDTSDYYEEIDINESDSEIDTEDDDVPKKPIDNKEDITINESTNTITPTNDSSNITAYIFIGVALVVVAFIIVKHK